MEKYLVLATFVGSIIALLFVVITAKKVLRFSGGHPPHAEDLPVHSSGC